MSVTPWPSYPRGQIVHIFFPVSDKYIIAGENGALMLLSNFIDVGILFSYKNNENISA